MVNPRLLTITLAAANTPYSLLTLLQAVDDQFTTVTAYQRCRRISIQADFDAGGARFFVGNADLSLTVFGVELVASMAVLYEDDLGDTVHLSSLFVMCTEAAQTMHCGIQFR